MSWCSVPNISTLAGVLYQIYQHELVYCTEYFNTSWCTVPKILTLANVLYQIYQHELLYCTEYINTSWCTVSTVHKVLCNTSIVPNILLVNLKITRYKRVRSTNFEAKLIPFFKIHLNEMLQIIIV